MLPKIEKTTDEKMVRGGWANATNSARHGRGKLKGTVWTGNAQVHLRNEDYLRVEADRRPDVSDYE